jgi:serine/threonine-protein kinase HipA
MTSRLNVYFADSLVGHMTRQDDNRIGFEYSAQWHQAWRAGRAHQISVSMPVSPPGAVLDATAFVAGLLPDSTRHRTLIAEEMGIGDDPSDFAFLSKMGRDSAGALTIIPEGQSLDRGSHSVEWLDSDSLADHLASLPRRPLLIDEEEGIVLSLAGVNDKAAVVYSKGRIGLPKNGMPSTHIIKVDIPGLEDSIKTEFFCLELAKRVGLRVPKSSMETVGGKSFMLMQRYDRTVRDGKLGRIHQEDFCQAFNVMPTKKYERYGGPGWGHCMSLMSVTVNPVAARETLLKQAIFQFLTGNPDAHAKNYSLVYRGASGSIDLSPIYDLNNAAAFQSYFKSAKPIMAMFIGKERNRDAVTSDDWLDFAKDCGISFSTVKKGVISLAEELLSVLPGAHAASPRCEAIDIAHKDIKDRCIAWGRDRFDMEMEGPLLEGPSP